MSIRVGFIGCGNMGGALAMAAAKSQKKMPIELYLADAFQEKAEELAQEIEKVLVDVDNKMMLVNYNIKAVQTTKVVSNEIIAETCDYIFLGVKPQMMREMLQSIAPILQKRMDRFVLVTMAAGLSIETIREMAGENYPIIRLMPNTPAFVGKGMILFTTSDISEEEKKNFLQFMQNAGNFDEIPESMIDAGSAVSGCGPAFVYQFIEALADGAVACGVPRAKAIEYAAQTLSGAAEMVLQTKKHPGELKDAVCSPAGSTIQGVRALEANGFRSGVIEAVISAYEKTKELGKK